MSSRQILTALLLALAASPAAEAQQGGRAARVGILSSSSPSAAAARTSSGVLSEPTWRGFEEGLRDLGWTEGRDLFLERRFADGKLERLPELAQGLVRINVDVIVTFGPQDRKGARADDPAIAPGAGG
jgi:putative tryptophan/tyrosine transport system substrate-binding protein